MATTMTKKNEDAPLIRLVNPATGVTFEYQGWHLRPGKATVADVKRGWADYPGDKVWLPLPVGVQTQLDAGRLRVATEWEAREQISADSQLADPAMPRGNASHDLWLAYAVSQGMSRDEAAGLTRDQLRARFMTPVFDPEAPPAEIGAEYEVLS
jgi:hypothetical protein